MTPPPDPWRDASAARLPAAALGALAPLRAAPGVRVHSEGDSAWVTWPAGRADVPRALLPVAGAVFFVRRESQWFRVGSRLPTSEALPAGDGVPLAGAVTPARFAPEPAPPAGAPLTLRLVRGGPPRPSSALLCDAMALRAWADAALTSEIEPLRAAVCGDRALVLGANPPPVPGALRLWGADALLPLGWRAEPDFSEADLRAAAGVGADELLLLTEASAEAVPRGALAPLTRAGARLL